MDHREAPECLDEAPHQGGPKRRKLNSLPQSLISEKQLTPEGVMGDEKNEQSLPEALPPLEVPTIAEEGPTPVRRSGRKRIMKKPESSKDSDSKRKKVARPLFKTATKLPEKNKRTRASKCEEDSINSKQDLTVKRSRKKRKPEGSCDSCSKTPPKVELIGDDERGHAIAEWYLLDIFEATRLITSNLHEGTQVTDCLVANMEETIIEIISKLLQRLSSVLITTLEQEFGIKCNILPVLRNLHENIKENVNQFAAKENDNSGIKFEPDEDSYQQALRCLDPKETVSVFEEVISSPFDEDCMLIEHAYCRPSEQEVEKTTKKSKGNQQVRQKFQCGFCTFKTYWKSKLRRHVKHHLNYKKRFECNVCDYTAATTEAYSKHVRTHTGEKPFKCDLCDFRTANKSNLNRHKTVHEDFKPHACPHCDYSTRQKGSLMQHIECQHNPLGGKKRGEQSIYACGDCSFITISRGEFHAHAKTHNDFRCGFCNFIGKDYKHWRRHRAQHKGEFYVCQKCKQKFISTNEFRQHLLESHDETLDEFACHLCSFSTSKEGYLKRHIASHSSERPFKCDVCFLSFKSQGHLSMHSRKHEIYKTSSM